MLILSSFSKLLRFTLSTTALLAGCAAEVQTRPAYVVYGGYHSHPHTVYRGQPVYYFDGGWHYRHGQRWVYVDETPDLYHYRTRSRHARNAPEASRGRPVSEHSHREHEYRRSAPSAD